MAKIMGKFLHTGVENMVLLIWMCFNGFCGLIDLWLITSINVVKMWFMQTHPQVGGAVKKRTEKKEYKLI